MKKSVLAQNIANFRKAKGWSQADLAEEAHVSLTVVKNLERDVKEGSTGSREAIARALGVSKEDLFRDPNAQGYRALSQQFEHRKAFPLSDRVVTEGPTALDVAEIAKRLVLVSPARRALILAVLFEEPSLLDGFPDLRPLLQSVPGNP